MKGKKSEYEVVEDEAVPVGVTAGALGGLAASDRFSPIGFGAEVSKISRAVYAVLGRRSIIFLLLAVSQLSDAAHASSASEDLLSATWLGRVGEAEVSSLAVSWHGTEGRRLEVWAITSCDSDADGAFAAGARLQPGMQVIEIDSNGSSVPTALRLRVYGDRRVEVVEEVLAVGSDCTWVPKFFHQGLNNVVFAVTVHDDGSGDALYAAGFFQEAGGTEFNNVARWDGEQWSPLTDAGTSVSGTNGTVRTLASFDEGSGSGPVLLVGGDFGEAGGGDADNVARWNGSSWSSVVDAATTVQGTNGPVDALAVFNDGSGDTLYVGGEFTSAGGVTAHNIASWDGSNFASVRGLGPGSLGANGAVRSLAVSDVDGVTSLYAGGSFTLIDGVPTDYVARWDGANWTSLTDATTLVQGTNNSVLALANHEGEGSGLYVGGFFTAAGGKTASHVARWDGANWFALVDDSTGEEGTDGSVKSLQSYDEGGSVGSVLFLGGFFDNAAGTVADHIARWDGSVFTVVANETSYAQGTNLTVEAMTVFDEGGGAGSSLYVGGAFDRAGSLQANAIARWGGSRWTTLGGSARQGIAGAVSSFASYDDGAGSALYAGGSFDGAGGELTNSIARWNGTGWTPLRSDDSTAPGVQGGVLALAVYDDGSGKGRALYVGGTFLGTGDLPANRILGWDGSRWFPLTDATTGIDGVNGDVFALEVFDDGGGEALYAGGSFTAAGGATAHHVARWDGAHWTALEDVGTAVEGTDATVYSLKTYDDGDGLALYVGGAFVNAGGVSASSVARFDGANWSALTDSTTLVEGTNHFVNALAEYNRGDGLALYVGGFFTRAGDRLSNGVARWDGSNWQPLIDQATLGNGANGAVHTLHPHNGGGGSSLYVGGHFSSAGGVLVNSLARWDGANWSEVADPFALGGVGPTVSALASHDDGTSAGFSLFVGGSFGANNPLSPSGIAQYGCGLLFADGFETGDLSAW